MLRQAHRVADFFHRALSRCSCSGITGFYDLQRQIWILFVFSAAFLHRRNSLNEIIRRPALALNTAYTGRSATDVDFFQSVLVAENLVEVAYGADIGITGICASHARRVSDHGL